MGLKFTLFMAFMAILNSNPLLAEASKAISTATTSTSTKGTAEVTSMNLDTSGIVIKEAVISADSADQKDKDKLLEANRADFENVTTGHIEGLYKCQQLGDANKIKECREASFKK